MNEKLIKSIIITNYICFYNSLSLKEKTLPPLSISTSLPSHFSLPNLNFSLSRCRFYLWWWLFILDGFWNHNSGGGSVADAAASSGATAEM